MLWKKKRKKTCDKRNMGKSMVEKYKILGRERDKERERGEKK